MTDARVQASLAAADMRASGSLGGLQILNLLSVSPVHQRIVSVGREPLIEEQLRQQQQEQLYPHSSTAEGAAADTSGGGRQEAFTFTLDQRVAASQDEDSSRSAVVKILLIVGCELVNLWLLTVSLVDRQRKGKLRF